MRWGAGLLNPEDLTVYKIIYTAVDEKPEALFKYLKTLVGERGFEPPTPWSRTRFQGLLKSVVFCGFQLLCVEYVAGYLLRPVGIC